MYTLGISETANELKIGKHTIYKIINEKNIKTYRVGRRVVFDSEQSKQILKGFIFYSLAGFIQ